VELGTLSKETRQKLEHVEATWLEFVPESLSLEVRHVQPDNRPALPEIAGELPVSVVPEPYQRLNGKLSFEGIPTAADDIRQPLERTAGLYSEGDFEIVAGIAGIEVALCDVNASVLPLVYALQVLAKPGSLEGEIDVSSFRAGGP
jgi:hypothetical protein